MQRRDAVGTWNVRILFSAGQLDVLLYQLRVVRWSFMDLSEVRLTRTGERLGDNIVKGEYSTLVKNKWEQTKEKNRDSRRDMGGDLAPSLGDGKKFADQNFRMRFFRKKNSF